MTETVISSSVLIIIIILIRTLFKGKIKSSVRYALWLIAAVRLMLPFGLMESPISVMNFAEDVIKTEINQEEVIASESELYIPETAPIRDKASEQYEEKHTPKLRPKQIWKIVRRSVTAIILLWFGALNIRFSMMLKKSRKEFVYDAPLKIYTSSRLISPCIFGLFSPTVYIPERSAKDSEAVRYIVAHEVCHYRHGDLLWTVVRYVLPAVYWFDPLVWAAAILSKRDCECACDEAAVKMLGEEYRFRYGKAIIDLIPPKSSESFGIISTSMASGKNVLKERMQFIAARPVNRISAVAVSLTVALLAAGSTFTSAQGTEKPVTSVEAEENTSDDGRINASIIDRKGAVRELIFFPAPEGYESYIYMDEYSAAKNSDSYGLQEFTDFFNNAAFSRADISLEDNETILNKQENSKAFEMVCSSVGNKPFDGDFSFDDAEKAAQLSFSRANGGFSSALHIDIYRSGGKTAALMVGDDLNGLTKLVTNGLIPTGEELVQTYNESRHFEAVFDGERLYDALCGITGRNSADEEDLISYDDRWGMSFSENISVKLDVVGMIPKGYVRCELRNIVFAVPNEGSLNQIGGSILWQNEGQSFNISKGKRSVPEAAEELVGEFCGNPCSLYIGTKDALLIFADNEGDIYSASAEFSSDAEKNTIMRILGSLHIA